VDASEIRVRDLEVSTAAVRVGERRGSSSTSFLLVAFGEAQFFTAHAGATNLA
jgi:hypothetical protein